jgi:hypothetical protein
MAKGIEYKKTRVPERKCVVLRTIHRIQRNGNSCHKMCGSLRIPAKSVLQPLSS